MADFKFEITKELGTLSEGNTSSKKANYISYNDRPAKLDIREWFDGGEKMGKGITLTNEESSALRDILNGLEL